MTSFLFRGPQSLLDQNGIREKKEPEQDLGWPGQRTLTQALAEREGWDDDDESAGMDPNRNVPSYATAQTREEGQLQWLALLNGHDIRHKDSQSGLQRILAVLSASDSSVHAEQSAQPVKPKAESGSDSRVASAIAQPPLVSIAQALAHRRPATDINAKAFTTGNDVFFAPRVAPKAPVAGPVQLKSRGNVGVSARSTAQIASGGLAGGSAMPHAATIAKSFGTKFDVADLRATVGGAATDAAESLGATAYAAGGNVAFASAPDVHTAAHEAAHAVLQRRGIGPSSEVGHDDDVFERNADAVADAVVAGRDASALLESMLGHGGSGQSVQRRGRRKPEKQSDYSPTTDEVTETAASKDAAKADKLDIEWIKDLSPDLIDQIDSVFAGKKNAKRAKDARSKDKHKDALQRQFDKDKRALRKTTKDRLVAAGQKHVTNKDIDGDKTYQFELATLKKALVDDETAAESALTASITAQKHQLRKQDTITAPPADGVTVAEGSILARTNFMAWGQNVLTSAAAVKAHFKAIRQVPKAGGLCLHAAAATQFEKARVWFEANHPGYTFLQTGTGQSLRARHEGTHSHGKLGHPLGLSVDFDAYTLVHQDDPLSQFMLRSFGGTTDAAGKRTPGKNMLDLGKDGLPHAQVKALEVTTEKGAGYSAEQEKFLAKVDRAYQEMHATSERFRASLKHQMPSLKVAEAMWFADAQPKAAKLLEAEKALAQRKLALTRGKKKKKGKGAEVDIVVSDSEVITLTAQVTLLRIASDVARNSVLAHMKTAFNPWVNQLTKEMSGEMAKLSGPGSTAPIDAAKVGKLYTSIANTDNRKSLIGILKNNAKIFPNIDPKNPPSGDALKSQLLARIQEVRDAKWAPGELEARSQLIVRLTTDPTAVFGTSVKDTTGKRKRQDVVSKPSVMQYLERGFTRNDPMQPGGAGGKSKKGVFNAAFIKCMMMFGFDTLAAYSSTDTMHFDYVKGFDSIRGKSGDEYAPVG